jgi:hypothetical protein
VMVQVDSPGSMAKRRPAFSEVMSRLLEEKAAPG